MSGYWGGDPRPLTAGIRANHGASLAGHSRLQAFSVYDWGTAPPGSQQSRDHPGPTGAIKRVTSTVVWGASMEK